MVDAITVEEIVRIANDKLYVDSGIDWVAIIALLVSLITFGLQWRDRKKDRKEQRKLREQDRQEQLERTQKEDAVRIWNAEYPYKLKLFTEYYDTLYRFVNYQGSVKEKTGSNATTLSQCRIRATDIMDMCSLLNKYTEEAKVLFSQPIQKEIKTNYRKVEAFLNNPIGQGKSLFEYTNILENNDRGQNVYNQISENLKTLQQEIKDEKMMDLSRKKFDKELKLEGNKDE